MRALLRRLARMDLEPLPDWEAHRLDLDRRLRAGRTLQAIDLGLFMGWDDDKIVARAKERLRG